MTGVAARQDGVLSGAESCGRMRKLGERTCDGWFGASHHASTIPDHGAREVCRIGARSADHGVSLLDAESLPSNREPLLTDVSWRSVAGRGISG